MCKLLNTRIVRHLVAVRIPNLCRVVGDEIHEAVAPFAEGPEVARVDVGVVDPPDDGVLEHHLAAGAGVVVVQRLPERLHREAATCRHDGLPHPLLRRVQRERQVHFRALVRQLAHRVHHSHRGHGDLVEGQVEHALLGQPAQCNHQLLVVIQRLSHPHEHYVAHRLQRAAVPHLLQDFTGGQVRQQTHCARCAKLASHRAANLTGHTYCAVLLVFDYHRLD
mmetsp:Transcript_37005/g.80618  ORF Transcript_37005/g.80618 Transcript_37005/m.80618 type:complete len:222 (+) Transcript_37005:294-959(+)